MDTFKDPAIIGCVILAVIVICLAIFFYRQMTVLQEKVTNLENVIATTIKEVNETKKSMIGIGEFAKTNAESLKGLSDKYSRCEKTISRSVQNVGSIISELKEKDVIDIVLPKKRTVRKGKNKKKSVSFAEESSDSSDSSDSDSESEEDLEDVRKRLARMKRKKRG